MKPTKPLRLRSSGRRKENSLPEKGEFIFHDENIF